MTVRISETTAYEPDALVYCGAKWAPSALEVPNPVIVVEVLSPTTRRIDFSTKIAGYFTAPSLQHYLMVDPDQQLVIHHARGEGGHINTYPHRSGSITLDSPGGLLAFSEIYTS